MRLSIIEDCGSITVFLVCSGADDPVPLGGSRPFISPLSAGDLDDLRFYLEDYARLPVGEFLVRGELVDKEKLNLWGEALYAAVFADPEKIAAYDRVRMGGEVGRAEVLIRSNDPVFLGLPWELLKAPGESEPLSVQVRSFDRSLLLQVPARPFLAIDENFRVLMVIARPEGTEDVPFQAAARPLFQHLQRHDGPVQIVVLRPPSFAAFCEALLKANQEGRPYHAVHFDGHGAFGMQPGNGRADPKFFHGPEGVLLFEREAGGADYVKAADFAAALTAGGVPLVILNACQSGALDSTAGAAGPEASIAIKLLQDGAASVIAMSHSVYVVAAAAFMGVFYEQLFAGRSVSEAVNLGRKALRVRENSLRPSLKGPMRLQDWMVPVHYSRADLRLPIARKPQLSVMDQVAQIFAEAKAEGVASGTDPLAAEDGVFFGRDNAFFTLERAVRIKRAAVVHGVGGVGKTELAKAFARWLVISNGLDDPRLVFLHEFKAGMASFGLDAVLSEILARLGQAELYLQAPDTRTRAALVLQVLAQMRSLLIWDNFESVASMPEPGQATPPLDAAKQQELVWFIGELNRTRSALLITSRVEEDWLGGPDHIVRLEIGGLAATDALLYADHLLEPHPAAIARRANEPESFKALIDHLDGHPLSLRLILPHMAKESPAALLDALKGLRDLPENQAVGERRAELQSVTASILYSFRHLPQADQQRLVILSLFEQVASAMILGCLADLPPRFAGLDITGWDALLGRLTGLGLVSLIGGGLYRMHPALPSFLASLWRQQAGTAHAAEQEQVLATLIGAAASFAGFLNQQISAGEAEFALVQIRLLRPSLSAFLAATLNRSAFAEAQAIIQPLNEYWDASGLSVEAQHWSERVIASTTSESDVPEIETDAHNLWLFVKGSEANRAQLGHRLDQAETIHRQIAASFEGRQTDKAKQSLAVAYHQLGLVAQDRGRLEEAENWYKRALAISEALGDQAHTATSYHQLGLVAQRRSQLEEAEGWYKRSLAIKEVLGNQPGMATSYHQLGVLAQRSGRLEEAENWLKRSLAIKELLGNQSGMAMSYYQLGVLAQRSDRLDEAEDWLKRCLGMFEALGNQPSMAMTYHQLGLVAQDFGRLKEAEGWLKRALAISEALGDQPAMATSYHQLGIVAQDRGWLEEAEEWYKRSFAILEALGNQPGMATSYHQLGTVAQLRGRLEEAESWYKRSLATLEALGNQPGIAMSDHQLGIIAQLRGRLEEAEGWYKRALAINEAMGNQPGTAISYHQLGMVAQDRGRLKEAEGLYKRSLAITEALGDQPSIAKTLANLGQLQSAAGDQAEALHYAIRAFALLEEFPNPHSAPPAILARHWRSAGRNAVARAWEEVTGQPLPPAVETALVESASAITERETTSYTKRTN